MAAEALEKSALEAKDKEQLVAIAEALGVKTTARATKASLVEKILEKTGPAPAAKPARAAKTEKAEDSEADETEEEARPARNAGSGRNESGRNESGRSESKPEAAAGASSGGDDTVYFGPDGEPLAEWEVELAKHEGRLGELKTGGPRQGGERGDRGDRGDRNRGDRNDRGDRNRDGQQNRNNNQQRQHQGGNRDDEFGEGGRRRRRRRGRNGRDEGPQGDDRFDTAGGYDDQPVSNDPVKVEGYLDLRDEGYGFLRLGGYVPTREDAYIPVKLTRQYGLRKGDHVTGLSRPAGRNEKNPAMLEIHSVNGMDPEKARQRPRFEDLTPLFPDHKLRMEDPSDPANMTARIIDLLSPVGMGQRGLAPPP